MKASKRQTLTGAWYEFENLVMDDFNIEVQEPRQVNSYAWESKITLTLKAEHQDSFIRAWDEPENYESPVWVMLESTGLSCGLGSKEKAFQSIVIYASQKPKLTNVRKEATKRERSNATLMRLQDRMLTHKQRWIDEKIAGVNEMIRRHVDSANDSTLRHAESTLGWYDPWVEEADKKAGNDALNEAILLLQEQLKDKKVLLRERRNAAFYQAFEEEGWVAEDGVPLPEPIVDAWKEMLKNNKAFVSKRFGF